MSLDFVDGSTSRIESPHQMYFMYSLATKSKLRLQRFQRCGTDTFGLLWEYCGGVCCAQLAKYLNQSGSTSEGVHLAESRRCTKAEGGALWHIDQFTGAKDSRSHQIELEFDAALYHHESVMHIFEAKTLVILLEDAVLVKLGRALDTTDAKFTIGFCCSNKRSTYRPANIICRSTSMFEKIRLLFTRKLIINVFPFLGFEGILLRARNHVELFGSRLQPWEEDFEEISIV